MLPAEYDCDTGGTVEAVRVPVAVVVAAETVEKLAHVDDHRRMD